MGTSSNKEQKIEVHLHLNVDKNGGKSQEYTIPVNSNNPSTIININGSNSVVASETTETSQISQNTGNIRDSQNNGNKGEIENIQNIQNNDDAAAAPMSLSSSQQIPNNSINTNSQFDINAGGDGGIKGGKKFANDGITNIGNIDINRGGNTRVREENETYGKPTKGNIDINRGGNRRVGEGYETYGKPTKGNIDINRGGNRRVGEGYETYGKPTKGNIDINRGGNRRVGEGYETYGKPTKGNIDINRGGNRRVGEGYETPKETPYPDTTKIGYADNKDLGNSQSDNLGLSRAIYVAENNTSKNLEDKKEMIDEKVKQGLFPLFMELNENKPQFMWVKNTETIKDALEIYKSLIGLTNDNKEYSLYNTKNNEEIRQNIPIKDLGLIYFAIISNKPNNK